MEQDDLAGLREASTQAAVLIERPRFIGCGHVARLARQGGVVNQSCHDYTGGVTRHDGRVLADPFVYPIFWGSGYSTRGPTGILTSQHPCIASIGDLMNSLRDGWLSGLNQYGVHSLGASPGQADTLPPGTDPTGLTQAQIEQELVRFIASSGVGIPTPHEVRSCFLIVLPNTADLTDAPGACGYHGSTYYAKATGDHNLFYAVIAAKGVSLSLSGDSFINSISYCITHELAEMFTNPDGRGWFADADPAQGREQTCEIGDICESKGTVQILQKWTAEKYWSQAGSDCYDLSGVRRPPVPPRQNCQVLAMRLGQLEGALLEVSREPPSPSQQAQLLQLERELATAQATYQRECIRQPLETG